MEGMEEGGLPGCSDENFKPLTRLDQTEVSL